MQSSNPVLTRGKYAGFDAPQQSAQGALQGSVQATVGGQRAMSIDDVVTRTSLLLSALLVTALASYAIFVGFGLLIIAVLVGFILAIFNTVSKKVRPPLMFAYAICEGVVIGTITRIYNDVYSGIAAQAVIGTVAAFVGILALYRSGKLRATPRFTRVLMGAAVGYLVLGLISFIASLFHVGNGMGLYGVSGLGALISVAGVAIASLFLVLDFDQIEKGIQMGAPEREAWRASFGLLVTLVWIYLEVLRLLSILRR